MLPYQGTVELLMRLSAVSRHTVLTVITPCLNAVDTISDTLLSISLVAGLLNQYGWDLEHHIIDGGSSDGTIDVVESFQKTHPFCLLASQIRGGPYAAMNYGLNHSSGYFTHVLNSDDIIWNVRAYVDLIVYSLEHKASYLLSSIVYFRRPSLTSRSCWLVEPLPPSRADWKIALKRGLHYPHPGFIARTDLYKKPGFDLKFNLSADYKLMQSLLIASHSDDVIYTCKEPIVAMAEGGVTGHWQSIISGYWQLRVINRQLGIKAPAWRRYSKKLFRRYWPADW